MFTNPNSKKKNYRNAGCANFYLFSNMKDKKYFYIN